MTYFRPIAMTDAARPAAALRLADGWCWFDRVEVLERGRPPVLISATDVQPDVLARLTAPRASMAGLSWDKPRLMGILNVTPDSFSDGGLFLDPGAAQTQGRLMAGAGADIIDVGGESTRPGALLVRDEDEIARTAPVISALRDGGISARISVDTRKADVAQAALQAGADLLNDVSALTFDEQMAGVAAASGSPICLMHAQGTPQDMQISPQYDDVLLDVYDFLESRIAVAVTAGIARDRIIVDPGIGFGKTLAHNLALIRGLSLFHALGCPLLLGVSRKKFIGTIGGEDQPARRGPGSVAVALAGVAQGCQILRVHDVWETQQALILWQSVMGGGA
jgi:dihydropteroate synthase